MCFCVTICFFNNNTQFKTNKWLLTFPLQCFSPHLFPSGCKTELVQLAVIPALPPAVASGTQESERAFRHWRPLILPFPEDPTLLQPLPVPGDGGVLGAASGCAPSSAACGETLLLWTGAPHRSGKLRAVVLLQHLSHTMRPLFRFRSFWPLWWI